MSHRFHVHLHVADLAQSIGFYSKLFGATPTRHETDYAKWMLDDPRVNFAISTRGEPGRIDHLGLQTTPATCPHCRPARAKPISRSKSKAPRAAATPRARSTG
jgi:catechol 2,3-dioxygenase-like lactoylglutathione lyase family enzyme